MIDSISPVSVQHSNTASFKGELPYSKTQSQEKHGMSAAQKTLIGLGALATLTIGGLLVKKHFDLKTVKKLAGEIAHKKNVIQNENGMYCDLYKKFDTKPLTEKLDEISKLPQKEQLNALENLESRLEFVQQIDRKLTGKSHYLPKRMNIPAEVQKAYEEGDLLKAGELMQKHAAGLPNTRIPKIHGKTVDETIKNVFGDNPPIKAHTYDLTKESPVIDVQRYGIGGYQEGFAGKEGTYFADIFTKMPDSKYLCKAISSLQGIYSKSHQLNGGALSEGVIKIDGKSRKVLRLSMPDGDDKYTTIAILSPNNKYTPVQEDLLKLTANPEKFNAKIFDEITRRSVRSDVIAKDPDAINQYVNLDYDLLLSAIQSMVK